MGDFSSCALILRQKIASAFFLETKRTLMTANKLYQKMEVFCCSAFAVIVIGFCCTEIKN